MYTYDVRTINPRDQGISLVDCLNRLARDGWRIVTVYCSTETGDVRIIVERPSNDR